MFKHFIITRFNLVTQGWENTKSGKTVLTNEWMEQRFDLFETFCLPSVINQSSQNFIWLIYFQKETHTDFKEKIQKITENIPNIIIKYISGLEIMKDTVINDISKLSNGSKYIITSRLDNDDSIHKDYVSCIQSKFNNQDFCVVDAINGYRLQIKPYPMLISVKQRSNPFVSIIEKNTHIRTVLERMHTDWKKEKIIITLKKFLWIQIIHENNLKNKFQGAFCTNILKILDFGININNDKIFIIPRFNNPIIVTFIYYFSLLKKTFFT